MKQSIKKLYLAIEKYQNRIKKIQGHCTHPNVENKHGSNTGNYDPSCDIYWTDHHCPDCDKRWKIAKEKEE